jgi:hypothetical protein
MRHPWMEAHGDRASYLLDLNHQKIMLTLRLDRIGPVPLLPNAVRQRKIEKQMTSSCRP